MFLNTVALIFDIVCMFWRIDSDALNDVKLGQQYNVFFFLAKRYFLDTVVPLYLQVGIQLQHFILNLI